jgi:chorismate-pyruvate lyase
MTVTVERFHQDTVDVTVLRSEHRGDEYTREILLKTHHAGVVVQYGIVRLFTKFLEEKPLNEILLQKKPLGRVLIEHDVLRKIELFDLLHVRCGPMLSRFFSVPIGTSTYGRTAMLHCNNEAAIELLEIVRP